VQSLREELTGLYAAANKGWLELLKHCYTKHPPMNPTSRYAYVRNLATIPVEHILE
jgi:hypothetical protein